MDVAVDIRKGSKTYGKYVCCEMSEENKLQFFVPKGFAYGSCVLSDDAVFQYKCDDFYHPEAEGAIVWNVQILLLIGQFLHLMSLSLRKISTILI